LLRVVLRGERNLLSLLPASAYRMRIGRLGWSRRGILLVNDPALVAEILRDPAQIFPKNDLMVGALEGLVGSSMFVSGGELWKRQRRMIDPAFSHMRIDRAFAPMQEAVEDHLLLLGDAARHDEPVSLDKLLSRLTADIVCRAIFSTSLATATARSVFDDFLIFERSCASVDVGALIFGRPWARINQPAAVAAACLRIRAHIGELLDSRTGAADDIAQAIVQARDPHTGEGFSREELIDQLGVFFLAGHETTASALTWAFFILAMHPASLVRLRAEVAQVRASASPGGPLTLAQARQLVYTRNVFREALRLYPPITFLPRVALRDTRIEDFPIRRGTMIMIAPWSLHRHADLWEHPDVFDPDRFVGERDRAHAAGAYIPFGLGPRVCVGAAFASLEATLILARLCEQFDFVPTDPAAVRPAARLTTRPEQEITVRLRSCAA
jgi:cytochrome P450